MNGGGAARAAPLRILLVEDTATDAELALRELRRASIAFEWRCVQTAEELEHECATFDPDVVLSDFSLPRFNGTLALDSVRKLLPDVPFIFVSGTIGEETAIESLRRGATDYVLKSNLARLPAAVSRAVHEAKERAALRAAEQRRLHSEGVFRSFMENLPGLAFTKDGGGCFTFVNRTAEWVIGQHSGDLVGIAPADLMRNAALDALLAGDEEIVAARGAIHRSLRLPTPLGDREWYVVKFPLQREDGASGIGGIAMDMTDRLQTEEALRLRDQAVESSVDPVIIVSASDDWPLIYANGAFERVTGYARSEVLGRNLRFLQGDDRDQPELAKIRRAIAQQRPGQALLRNYRKDGSLFWNQLYVSPVRDPRTGEVTHFVGVQHDITELKHYQDELEHQANHDALTGLPNRNLLKDRLQQAQALARRSGRKFALGFLDLDNFKLINDSLGHDVGDRVLEVVAGRLRKCVREGDTVARLGGDEFVMLVGDYTSDADVHAMIHKVVTTMQEPVVVGDREFKVTCSVGIATFPADGNDPDVLLRNADAAMYQAKQLGRDRYQFYSPEMNADFSERLIVEADLSRALSRGELEVFYQPKVDLRTKRVVGFEALVRWRHGVRGLMTPESFIPVAGASALIADIGRFVVATVCAQCAAWQKVGMRAVPVGVNISARELQDSNVVSMVRTVLEMTELEPELLEIEVTESAALSSLEESLRVLSELRAMGVGVTLDDFGTGYSSLSYLKRLPVTGLKIDQSFVRGLGRDGDDEAIVRAVVAVAQALSLTVTAEGVENAQQAELLLLYGCPEAQGFHFSRPVSAEEAGALLARGTLAT